MKRFVLLIYLLSSSILSTSAQTSSSAKLDVQSTSILKVAPAESVGMSSERLKRIDENVNDWMATGKLNGTVALIIRNGKIVYYKAFGYDDLEKTKPMKTDMIFRIASQTKAITSVAVMILYEEGKFLLDDAVPNKFKVLTYQAIVD